MILNNIECDLDELILRHGVNKIEAIRELRKLTGLTLKEAKSTLENYKKGKLPKSINFKPGIFS
ncbi:MAG: ribosomal protein L7/L12 [Eubacterium sp.]|nr:ribosomal protein L7/L12 [Eubacterium sp.]